ATWFRRVDKRPARRLVVYSGGGSFSLEVAPEPSAPLVNEERRGDYIMQGPGSQAGPKREPQPGSPAILPACIRLLMLPLNPDSSQRLASRLHHCHVPAL